MTLTFRRLLPVLAVASASVAIAAPTAHAVVVVPNPSSFFVEGESGDTLVGSQHASFVSPVLTGTTAGVTVIIAEMGHTWTLELQPATGGTLAAGTYTDVMKAGTQTDTHPGLGLAGDNKSCTTITGQFIVDQIAFNGTGNATILVARWEVHCNGSVAASFGGVSINGSVAYRNRLLAPRTLTFAAQAIGGTSAAMTTTITNGGPSALHVTSAALTDTDAGEFTITDDPCSGTDIASGATCTISVAYSPVTDLGPDAARLTIIDDVAPTGEDVVLKGTAVPSYRAMFLEGEIGDIPVSAQHLSFTAPTVDGTTAAIVIKGIENGHNYTIELGPADGQTLAVGAYEDAQLNGSQTGSHPGLSVHGDGHACTTVSGRFVIEELTFGANGLVRRMAAHWEQHCEGFEAASFGALDYDATTPYRDRTIAPSTLAFGAAAGGSTTAAQTVTVTNNGPAALHIASAALTGPNATEFTITANTCTGATVPSPGSCAVSVAYSPITAAGSHTARLTFVDDVAQAVGIGSGEDVVLTGNASNSPGAGEFTGVTPARIVDTRNAIGVPKAPLQAATPIDLKVTGVGGVPATGVAAVVVNVTATNATVPGGFITLWPTGTSMPVVSNLNPVPGRPVPNMATVPVGLGGNISAFSKLGTVDLIVDVVGYYSNLAGPTGARFHPVDPKRLVDTRNGTGPVIKTALAPGGSLRFNVNGKGGLPATGMTAIVLNVTAVKPSAAGYLTVFPGDATRPTASNLNFVAGGTVPNLVTVRVPASGIVEFYNSAGYTNVLADVVGYYSVPASHTGDTGRFVPVMPKRAWDTRTDNSALFAHDKASFPIAGYDGIALTATAVVANVTAVRPTSAGYLTAFPDDLCSIPTVSSLNFAANQTVPNMVISRLSPVSTCSQGAGYLAIYNDAGDTHVLIDVVGYFMA